jgi:photosystem II stability/assembly factor-like uncharacterized protein
MRSFPSSRRSWRQILPLSGAGLLLCLFFALYAQATSAAAQADFIRVPGDAASIQAAIDLAAPGAEIRVQGGNYAENLVITKSLRLSGSWTGDWSMQDQQTPTILDAGHAGRAVTIYAADVAPAVVISYVAILNGSAAGLGGAVTPTVPSLAAASLADAPAAARPDPAALRAELATLAAQGLFPGGQAALDTLLARAAATASLQWMAPARLAPARAAAAGEIDCGGGVYVNGASLHLLTVSLQNSIAGAAGPGAGGGLCAVAIPAGGLVLQKVTMSGNFASQAATGYGGALFVDGGATPAAGALLLDNVRMDNNAASETGGGYGGGAFLINAPAAQLHITVFGANYASLKGLRGVGGGLYVAGSRDVQLNLVGFEGNTGVNVPLVGSSDWPIGEGGAIYIDRSPNFSITSPAESGSGSIFVGNLAALRGVGLGGALSVQESPGLYIEGVKFLGNWATIFPDGSGDTLSGGAIRLTGATEARIISSTFANNVIGVFNLAGDRLFGGALSANNADHLTLMGNLFQDNTCGTSSTGGLAHGGGVQVSASRFITITGNTFAGNAADLGLSGGFGGALHINNTSDMQIDHNRFERNRAGAGAGIGGAITVEGGGASTSFPFLGGGMAGAGGQGIDDPLAERVSIHANTFLANQAATAQVGDQANLGGALALNSINGLEFANNVLAGNAAADGAAIMLFGWNRQVITATAANAAVVNNTLFNNAGDNGVYLQRWTTPITLTNNIVVSHTVGLAIADDEAAGGSAVGARYNLYNDNGADSAVDPASSLSETGKIAGSVLFVEPWQGDFRLQPQSAAINAGDPAGVPPAPAVDIEDTPRPFSPRVDVGAYEWHGPVFNNYLPGVFKEACQTPPVAGWALGEREGENLSVILHTADGGLTWSRQYTSTLLLNGLAVGDRLHLWSVGDGGTILHSADGGATWQRQQLPASLPATTPVNRITATSATKAWAAVKTGDGVNNTAYVINTLDGGATWGVQASFDVGPGWINWIDAADANNIWAVGGRTTSLAGQAAGADGAGFIYHSADGGRTWRLELEAPLGPVIGIDAVSATVAWAAARQGAFRTLDGGATWAYFDIVATDANAVDSIGGEKVWVSGDYFNVLYTDKGLAQPLAQENWQDRSPAVLKSKVSYAVDFIDASNGWIAGGLMGADLGGVIARTCDGGLSWAFSRWEEFDPIRTVQMVPPAP